MTSRLPTLKEGLPTGQSNVGFDPPRWRISVSVLKRDKKQRSRTSEKIILPPIIATPSPSELRLPQYRASVTEPQTSDLLPRPSPLNRAAGSPTQLALRAPPQQVIDLYILRLTPSIFQLALRAPPHRLFSRQPPARPTTQRPRSTR